MVTELKIRIKVIKLTKNNGRCTPCRKGKWLNTISGRGQGNDVSPAALKRCTP
jgi:hypothetical protein